MSKKQEIIDYLQTSRRGESFYVRWLRFELWDKAAISASKATIRAALAQMRDDGNAVLWAAGRSSRWYIRKKGRGYK